MNIIVADVTSAVVAAKKATSTIPIVMTSITDPVGTGLVTSLARPGGNITGLINITAELGGKFVELLKEIVPKLNHVTVLMIESATSEVFIKETEIPARALGVQLIPAVVRGPDDFEGAFRAMAKERANGLVNRLPSSAYSPHFKRLAELAMRSRLPSTQGNATWTNAGGLVSCGQDPNASY